MPHHHRRSIAAVVFAAAAITACNEPDRQASQASQNTASATMPADTTVNRQNQALQHEKDSLMLAMRSVFEAMNSIDSATTLAGFKREKNHDSEHIVSDEVQIRDRALKALARLRVVQGKLKSSASRVAKLSKENGDLGTELAQYQQAATALQTQISTLTQQLQLAAAQNDSLTKNNKQLATTVDSFGIATRRGYVVAGPKRYLMEHNLVNEVGGSRFPFIAKVGSTLRPASAHFDTTLFKSMDRAENHVIQLDSAKRYEVVSSQDLDGVDRSNARGRVFQGSIHILDPDRFWKPSAFLILREL